MKKCVYDSIGFQLLLDLVLGPWIQWESYADFRTLGAQYVEDCDASSSCRIMPLVFV